MNSEWLASLDNIWRSPTFPLWLTLAAAGFFGLIVLATLLRAEKSVANGALTVIALLAVGIAVAANLRGFGPERPETPDQVRAPQPMSASLPALSCIDDLAGDAVLNACEKVLFGSAESVAAAVTYASAQISRLVGLGDVATAEKNSTMELQTLRRAVEHDRYGLIAYVLMTRDHCTPSSCAAFRSLSNSRQVVTNMDERTYENLVTRYAAAWNTAAPAAPSGGLIAALPSSAPTGKPTNAEFPTAASTPAVNIMAPEPAGPPAGSVARPATAAASPTPTAAKKQAAKRAPATAPVQIAPAAPASPPAAAPAAANND